jgi:hypothetical protein
MAEAEHLLARLVHRFPTKELAEADRETLDGFGLRLPNDPGKRYDEGSGFQRERETLGMGQRGWLCRVVREGAIRKGDAVTVLAAVAAEAK